MSQPFRNKTGGFIDRDRTWSFRFDGRIYEAHPGDTLASALLANGVRLVGRSFKYHRPRGIFSAGPEEPNALVELRDGNRREPNTRMTVTELFDGLEARSQNRFPSLRFDFLSVNALLAPLMPAGFYYKTFMWPPAFWEKFYEPLIRRAAGLGRAAATPDPDTYETLHAHCDVLVVGSGPAGLAAATVAGAAGARVILAEQDFLHGGGLLLDPAQEHWRQKMLVTLGAQTETRLLARTTVVGYYDHNVLGAVERVADHLAAPPPHTPRQRFWTIRAKSVVLATGFVERFIAFPGNDRPGVMLAGAAQAFAARFGVRAGDRAVLFANNDAAYESLFALQDAGIFVAGAVDPRTDSTAMAAARARGIAVWADSEITATTGRTQLSGVRIRRRNGTETALAADLLCLSGGINPSVQLASQSRTKLLWHDGLASFVPGVHIGMSHSVGAAAGITGISAAAADGARGGAAAATDAGFAADPTIALPDAAPTDATVFPLWEVKARGPAFVDLQTDVTAEDIRLAHREGYHHIEHAKRYTTHSMGTDQGKSGGIIGAAILAEVRGAPIATVGLPNFRPYVTPVTWGAAVGAHVGKDFAPTRRTALHAWHAQHGAVFTDAGLWLRPAYYPIAADKDAWASVLREASAVRQAVGICDVSTLGKIDVQGPDAENFLEHIYANRIASIPIGRARYGLMLREDGMVLDDGTVSRLAADHFFVSTTTANAAAVLTHMEFHLQTVWPDLDVQLASVTDHWAAMSLAGPSARQVLHACVQNLNIANESFPFMAVADANLTGCPVRVFRISFSGELAYEIATPSGHAQTVWRAVLEAGRAHGITPYGTEALGLLRIEKGHPAGAELNGQTTANDLGLGRMCGKKSDFVGRVLARRPGLTDPARPRLVGILPTDPDQELRAGAHLVLPNTTESLGWISSVTRSVILESWIGLAFLQDGERRTGENLHATFPLKNELAEIRIVSPHFVDPDGKNVRA